jgi:hypothetical protein
MNHGPAQIVGADAGKNCAKAALFEYPENRGKRFVVDFDKGQNRLHQVHARWI